VPHGYGNRGRGPYPRHIAARISPAQNVPFWCSIGHYSYDKIAGGYRLSGDAYINYRA